jgi:two-component system, LytTR family, sensor kinase
MIRPLEAAERTPYPPPARVAPWRWYAFVVAIWTIFALLSVAQGLARMPAGRDIPWAAVLSDRMADWYTCALFTPAYFWLARHYPVIRPHWKRGVVAHLAATQLFVVVKYALYVSAGDWLGYRPVAGPLAAGTWRVVRNNVITENMAFWAVAAVVHAIVFHRAAQEREARAERLRSELVQARLDALTGQLHPHFLFNALNSVSALMHRDLPAADAMLARLGDLLRRTLRAGESPEVTLEEEFALLGDYLAVVGVRFRDRLSVEMHLEPGTERAMVPHFLLQPLVENALEHGISRRAGAGRIEVRSARSSTDGDTLVLSVSDDGPGYRADASPTNGIGLANTRRRLAALYADRQRLTLTDRPTGGLLVRVELPFHVAVRDDGAPATSDTAGAPRAAVRAT